MKPVPYLVGRLDEAWNSDPEVKNKLTQPPSHFIQKLYLDALVYVDPAIHSALRLVGAGHLMFGAHQPFSVSDSEMNINLLSAELSDGAHFKAVTHANAGAFLNL